MVRYNYQTKPIATAAFTAIQRVIDSPDIVGELVYNPQVRNAWHSPSDAPHVGGHAEYRVALEFGRALDYCLMYEEGEPNRTDPVGAIMEALSAANALETERNLTLVVAGLLDVDEHGRCFAITARLLVREDLEGEREFPCTTPQLSTLLRLLKDTYFGSTME